MKKLYIILIAALLLTLAACLTACSAVPMLSLADDKLQPPDSPGKKPTLCPRSGASAWSR